jgi:hypothetical protein
MNLRPILLTLVLLALSCAAAPSAGAVSVGLADHSYAALTEPRFDELGLKKVRVIVPWNVAQRSASRQYLDDWLAVTSSEGVEPFVSFGAAGGTLCPDRPCQLPSKAAFGKAFRAFRARWPQVRAIGVWNEANHRSQPTFKHPERAAQYFNVVKKSCRGCKIVAADVIDDPNMVRWLNDFKRVAKGPRIWGLHNYRDANPRRGQRYGGTKTLLRTVKGRVWLTESGGIVRFVLPNGHSLFPTSEKRANIAMGRLFRLARENRKRIDRMYVYHWRQTDSASRFDAGLLRADGAPRASYFTLARWLDTRWFTH